MRRWDAARVAAGAEARLVRAGKGSGGPARVVIDSRAVRAGDLFGVPLLSRRSLQLLVADLDHVRLLRGASGRLVHFPHHHLARYGRFLSRPYGVTVHDLIRFFDLKRFMDIPSVATYMSTLGLTGPKLLFPIPQGELNTNPLITQNPGY